VSSSQGGPTSPPADTRAPGPIVDIRVRWRAGQVALTVAGLMAMVALFRPLGPEAPAFLRLGVTLVLGLGVAGTALLSSLRGRGRAEQIAFYSFLILSLDALGQILSPGGWPIWPLMVLLLGALAVAEPLATALAAAGLAAVLALAASAAASFADAGTAATTGLAYVLLVLVLNRSLAGEKRRLSATLAELARLKHGIDQLEEGGAPPAGLNTASLRLRQVSEPGRRARQVDRAAELDDSMSRLVRVARAALGAHSVLYFGIDRERDLVHLRAADGPPSLIHDSALPLGSDPFGFVVDRGQAFYATDFKRLLWALPYYRGEVKIGSLLAVPVRVADVVAGVLVADRLEIQSLTGGEPDLLQSFAALAGESIHRARASESREEVGVEFKAVYAVSRDLATLTDPARVRRRLLRSARDLVALEAAAVVIADDAQTRYTVEDAHGWAREFEGREVGLMERTWAAWVLRSAEESFLLDNVAGQRDRMPILVLDEGAGRGESLLSVPLKAHNRNLGALVLTGRRGAFDAAAQRVLGILANQAAAALSTCQLLERRKDLALRDGLTGLYNRRAFNELLTQALAREDRQGGRFALLLLDIDHFKKLNDTFGHPAGDAALKNTARVLEGHLRRGDQAARFGGEEFAVILPGADRAGALHLAERVRDAVQKDQIVFEGARISVTVSLGAALWPEHARAADALLAAADRALYAAKEAGRNRVVPASAPPPEAPTSGG
jgi:diguanylate cyclase (GGDEF)-like protein